VTAIGESALGPIASARNQGRGDCLPPWSHVDWSELMFDTCVLGVDPGVARLGLAVLRTRENRLKIEWASTVMTSPQQAEGLRLQELAVALKSAIDTYRPDSMAIERLSFNRNAVSALAVARAIGAIMLVAAQAGLAIQELTPTQVKSAVTGSGSADKAQVREAMVRIHGLADVPKQADAADAVAVALASLSGSGLRAAAARSGLG
jgi:crossover junction endodeoxyribonuclease RuvC